MRSFGEHIDEISSTATSTHPDRNSHGLEIKLEKMGLYSNLILVGYVSSVEKWAGGVGDGRVSTTKLTLAMFSFLIVLI